MVGMGCDETLVGRGSGGDWRGAALGRVSREAGPGVVLNVKMVGEGEGL